MNVIEENPEIAEKVKKMNDLVNLLDWFIDRYEKVEVASK